MNNISSPTLTAISNLIQSHLAFLQQQSESSPNPHINCLLQAQFHDHLSQTLSSLQSYTSQQIAITQLTPTPPLSFYPPPPFYPLTSPPNPPTHTPPPPNPPTQHTTQTPQPPNPTASQRLKFYAVRRGRTCNVIFTTWEECKPYVHHFSGAEFKSFQTYLAAQAYLSTNSDPTPDNLPQ
jgi:hypothetical protein